MTKDEALKLAVTALEYHQSQTRPVHQTQEAITALRTAIEAADKQEPVATLIDHYGFTDGVVRFDGVENMEQLPIGTKFYIAPPTAPVQDCFWKREGYKECPEAQRQWVGLTDEEFVDFVTSDEYGTAGLIAAVVAKLKEKNT